MNEWMNCNRKKVHILERYRAEDVPDGNRADQRAPVQVQHHFWEIVAAAAGLQAFHRPRPFDGERGGVAPPEAYRGPGIHGGQAQGHFFFRF